MSALIQFEIIKPEQPFYYPYLQIKFSSCSSYEIASEGELDEFMDNRIMEIEKARKKAKEELRKMICEVQNIKERYKP